MFPKGRPRARYQAPPPKHAAHQGQCSLSGCSFYNGALAAATVIEKIVKYLVESGVLHCLLVTEANMAALRVNPIFEIELQIAKKRDEKLSSKLKKRKKKLTKNNK